MTETLLSSDKENNPNIPNASDAATLVANINSEVIKLKKSLQLAALPVDFLIKLLQGLDDLIKPHIGKASTMVCILIFVT
jgi:hypothetical protein